MQAFGLAAAFGHLGFNWTAYFMARGETKPIAVHSVVAAAAFVAIELPLILAHGLRGVAVGTVALVAASLAVRRFYLRRLFPGFHLGRHALRALAPALPAAGLVLLPARWRAGTAPRCTRSRELALYLGVTSS